MAEMTIRQADASDAAAIHEIECLCFPDPWSLESLLYEFERNPLAFYVVGEIEGEIVGYAGLWWIEDEGHITNVAVRPEYRGRQIGSQILETMIAHTEEQGIMNYTLEVRADNRAAQALYRKYGFAVEGVRKGYYREGREDALIMWRRKEPGHGNEGR